MERSSVEALSGDDAEEDFRHPHQPRAASGGGGNARSLVESLTVNPPRFGACGLRRYCRLRTGQPPRWTLLT